MSRRDAGHFYQLFDKLWKFMIMIIAYMVPPYGIKWERRRRKNIFIFVNRFPSWYANNVPAWRKGWIFLGNNIVPVIDLHSRSYLDKSKFFIRTSIFKKMCHLQLHSSFTKCIFRQMSRRDADDEFIWEII